MKRTDGRIERSLFGAWVLRILKECVKTERTPNAKDEALAPQSRFRQADSQGLTQRITVGFKRQPNTMASRLPRCLTATHGMFASGIRSTGTVELLQRRMFSASPPPLAVGVRGGQPGKPEVSKHVCFSYSVYRL